jgi:hypothetical protein
MNNEGRYLGEFSASESLDLSKTVDIFTPSRDLINTRTQCPTSNMDIEPYISRVI